MMFVFNCVQFIQNISILMHLWTHQFWKWWVQTDFDESRTHGIALVRILHNTDQIWILEVSLLLFLSFSHYKWKTCWIFCFRSLTKLCLNQMLWNLYTILIYHKTQIIYKFRYCHFYWSSVMSLSNFILFAS